jgi:metallo-beta-lactamase family protein
MKLTFLGAAGEFTGSCLLVETGSLRVLVDCGMFQGAQRGAGSAAVRNLVAMQRDLGRLDFVLLTHAHLDHCGLLPRFARGPHRPTIYCTKPTADLLGPMLKDSVHIQLRNEPRAKDDAERGSRSRSRFRARFESPALYTSDDVDALLTQVSGVPIDVPLRPHPDLGVTFRNAGHIIGAAILEITIRERGRERRLVISGDLGEASPLLVHDRASIASADVLVVESTYGDRNHRTLVETEDELVEILHTVMQKRRGNVIVPAFALGRTQEFLLLLYRLMKAKRTTTPLVFVDSPLAQQASVVTFRHLEALDGLAQEFVAAERAHRLPFALRFTESAEDSMFLNSIRSGAVIIAASGMCDAGRIRHHLRHNLGRHECGIVFTGFQAAGTLGRKIVDGAREVSLFGDRVPVRASIHTLGGLSAHAGQDSLLEWLRGFGRPPAHCFIVHGEPSAAAALEQRVGRELGWQPRVAAPTLAYEV